MRLHTQILRTNRYVIYYYKNGLPGFVKGLSKEESLDLGFELRQSGETAHTVRRRFAKRRISASLFVLRPSEAALLKGKKRFDSIHSLASCGTLRLSHRPSTNVKTSA